MCHLLTRNDKLLAVVLFGVRVECARSDSGDVEFNNVHAESICRNSTYLSGSCISIRVRLRSSAGYTSAQCDDCEKKGSSAYLTPRFDCLIERRCSIVGCMNSVAHWDSWNEPGYL